MMFLKTNVPYATSGIWRKTPGTRPSLLNFQNDKTHHGIFPKVGFGGSQWNK